ncbi:hypothetical protein QBC39DRAFT_365657 [Podospora conica]|nr:hypothetical protein QBC39DRAFT_365657 [Schizothecium conicum]
MIVQYVCFGRIQVVALQSLLSAVCSPCVGFQDLSVHISSDKPESQLSLEMVVSGLLDSRVTGKPLRTPLNYLALMLVCLQLSPVISCS